MKFLFFVLAVIISLNVFAQSINGTVKDANGEALPGASVLIVGTTNGIVTMSDGSFVLGGIDEGSYQLKASFIGYEDVLLEAKTGTSISVVLNEDNVITEEVFVYATRAGSKTPMAVSNVGKEEIAGKNMGQDIPYLLATTPSFVTTSDAGAGVGYTGFRVRGSDANRINVTVNGIPMNDAESHGVFWVNMPDFSSSVENVQVQRGVGTSTHGAGAFGATINMQTNSLRKDAYAEYSNAGGSFNTFKNTVRVGSGLISDHFAIDARLSKITSDGYIDRASTDLKSFFVSGGYYGKKTIVKLNVFSGKEKTDQAWWGVPTVRLNNDVEGMNRYNDHWLFSTKTARANQIKLDEMLATKNPRTYNIYTYDNETDNYQQDHYQLLLNHQVNKNLSLNVAGHYTYGRGYYENMKLDQKFKSFGLDNPVVENEVITNSDMVLQKWLDNHFYGTTFNLNYSKNQIDFVFGGGINRYDGDHFGKIIWSRYATDLAKDYEWYRGDGVKTDFNTYAKGNYQINEVFNVYADLQYRMVTHNITGIDDDLRDLTQNHEYNFFNPKFGVMAQLDKTNQLYASYAKGSREPNRSNFVDADPTATQPTFETLQDIEAGYKYSSSTISAGANVYYMLYKDQLVLTGEINDVGGAIMTNVDNSYRAGIELMLVAKLLPNLTWDANVTFSQNKISDFTEYVENWDAGGLDAFELGETNIAFSPNMIANSQLKYSPIDNFEINLISQFVGKQFIDNTSNDDRMLDQYFINSIKLSYTVFPKFMKEIKFNLLVNNLADAEYETNAWVYSYITGDKRYKMDGYFPQAGTNFFFGIDFKF